MVRLATPRPALPQPGLPVCQTETYYPTTDTRLHVSATTAGLGLFYENDFGLPPECLRFAFSETTVQGRRRLTIEIEYSPEPACPSEL